MPTVVVTGTDHGLGRAFVDEFVAQGFFVFAVLSLHPGWLKTPMANFEGPVAPEEAAARIARLVLDPTLETPKSSGFLQYDGATHPW